MPAFDSVKITHTNGIVHYYNHVFFFQDKSANKTSFLHLPDEIILEIFTYLHKLDLKSIRRVCTRLNAIAWSPEFSALEVILLRDQVIRKRDFNYNNLNVAVEADPIKSFKKTNFLKMRGENIKKLSVKFSSPNFGDIWQRTLALTPNLVQVSLNYRLKEQMIVRAHYSLPNVREFEIRFRFHVNSNTVLCFLLLAKHLRLEKLTKFVCHFGSSSDMIDETEWDKLLIKSLNRFLLHSKSTLKHFEFNGYSFLEPYLPSLTNLLIKMGPQMRELSFNETTFNSISLIKLSDALPNIKVFSMVTSDPQAIYSAFPDLDKFELVRPFKSFDGSILRKLSSHLISVVIETAVSGSVLSAFRDCQYPKIKEFTLIRKGHNVNIGNVIRQTPNLTVLTIGSNDFVKGVDNAAILVISQHCKKLRDLSIYNSANVTDVNCLSAITGLERLGLKYCGNLRDSGVSELTFSELRKLEVIFCSVTVTGVRAILGQCLAIRHLLTSLKFTDNVHTPRSRNLVEIKLKH